MAAQPLRAPRQAQPGHAGGRSLGRLDQERRVARVEGEADGRLAGGIEDQQLAAVGGDRGESLGADREVFHGRPQFLFPDPAARRSQSADPVALLDQGQSEVVGLDGEVSELDQADVETAVGVAPQVAEDDLAVGRGGQPAGRRPEDPADAGHVGPLSQFLARDAIQLKAVRAGEKRDRRAGRRPRR